MIHANAPIPELLQASGECVDWLQAEASTDSAAPAKLKRFSGVAYTGGPMRANYYQPVVIDLAGLTMASEVIPFLSQHEPSS